MVTDAEIHAAYAAVGQVYRPWTHWFQPPHVNVCWIVSTNGYGFRSGASIAPGESVNVVLGSSAVFGVGASSDAETLTAHLARLTGERWLNFGGRAFNSTQELILFLLHRPDRIKRLVVCSGVNTILLAAIAPVVSPIDNAFFSQTVVETAVREGKIGVRPGVDPLTLPPPPTGSRYEAALACQVRDWRRLAELAPAITYVLQPCFDWCHKVPTAMEAARLATDTSQTRALLRDQYPRFRLALMDAFPGVVDANEDPRFWAAEDLFFDLVHLTDLGYRRLAEVIAEAL